MGETAYLCAPLKGLTVIFSILLKKKVPNVNQKMGKYLTPWDYPQRQMNITVFRNVFTFESNISLPDFYNKDAMSCKVYEPSLAFYHQRQSFGTNDRPII